MNGFGKSGAVDPNPTHNTVKVGDVPSGNFTEIEPDGTIQSKGEATCWTDLRVPVSATEVNGSNPPTDALFRDNGQEIPGDSYSVSFLSTAVGNLIIPDDVVFNTANDFTFEFWLRPVVGTQNSIEFLRKRDVFELDFRGTNQINLDVKGGGGNQNSSVQFNHGSWNYIVVQHDLALGETRLYMNNILAITLGADTNNSTRDFEINRSETLFDIDYIAYWDSLLTPSEMTARYNAGSGQQLTGNEVGLKGLWELNDGSGTTVVEKTGISFDGTISGGTEGVEWAWIGGHVGNVSRGSRGVILKYFSPDNENELYFDVQMPHEWVLESDIRPHLHWVPNADALPGERCRWGLEFVWTNAGEVFGDTTLIYANDNVLSEDPIKNKHYISEFGFIPGAGKTLSSMLVCRIFRDATNIDDTFSDFAGLLEVDFHYLIDMLGSREEFVK